MHKHKADNTIPVVIGFSVVALVGLIIIQLYWINNAIQIKQERFSQTVHSAMHNVVEALERREAQTASVQVLRNLECEPVGIVAISDDIEQDITENSPRADTGHFSSAFKRLKMSIDGPVMNDSTIRLTKKNITARISGVQQKEITVEMLAEEKLNGIRGQYPAIDVQVSTNDSTGEQSRIRKSLIVYSDSLAIDNATAGANQLLIQPPEANTPLLWFENTQSSNSRAAVVAGGSSRVELTRAYQYANNIANRIILELTTVDKDIRKRIAGDVLDSTIAAELGNNGIQTVFTASVATMPELQQQKDFFTQVKNENEKGRYRVALFPNDVFAVPAYLTVEFPEQQSYLFQSIWLILATSVAFILVIACSFAFAVVTLVRQKKLSELKTDFINNMTHEFKTPIATISLAGEALQDAVIGSDPERRQRFVSIIREENGRLGMHVERVLQAAALDRGDFVIKPTPVNMNDVVEAAISGVTLQVEQKQGTVIRELRAANATIAGDRLHLTNVLYNLLDNANKYSNDCPVISVNTCDVDNGVEIRVKDNGIGMSKETQKRIFEKFYRVPTGNLHDVKGFGLGLNYVRKIISAHGGSVKVQSELQQGSIFTIFLPHKNGVVELADGKT